MGLLDGLFKSRKKRKVYAEKVEDNGETKIVEKVLDDKPTELKSGDYGYKEAAQMVKNLKTPGDVKSFTKGDTRSTVAKAVERQIKALNAPKKEIKKKSTPGR